MFIGLTRAINSLVAVVRLLVDQLKIISTEPPAPMAERGEVGLRMSVVEEPAANGDISMSLAIALNNRQSWKFKFTPALKDKDGLPIKKTAADGSLVPITQEDVTADVSASNEAVTPLTMLGPDKKSGTIPSGTAGDEGSLGSSRVRFAFAYPDQSVKEFIVDISVGNSAPGDPEVESEVVEEDAATPSTNP